MSFNPNLKRGDILSNSGLSEVFKCGNMGGMRRSHETNTLVLVSDHTKSLYDDKWYGQEFHYTGEGKIGDQSLTYRQNRTLNESESNGIDVHLFEVFSPGKYVYQGTVSLVKQAYQENQLDDNDNMRKVWMFPLRLNESGVPAAFDDADIIKVNEKRAKQSRKLSNRKLKELTESKSKSSSTKRVANSVVFDRDQNVVEYALRRAEGICQLCEQPAPFKKKDGTPFLEVHHIVYLRFGGSDTNENVAALCPNCHRKMHALEINSDVQKLLKKAKVELK